MNLQTSEPEIFHNQSRYHINNLLLFIILYSIDTKNSTFVIFKFIELLMYHCYPHFISTFNCTFSCFLNMGPTFSFCKWPCKLYTGKSMTNFCHKPLLKTVHHYECLRSKHYPQCGWASSNKLKAMRAKSEVSWWRTNSTPEKSKKCKKKKKCMFLIKIYIKLKRIHWIIIIFSFLYADCYIKKLFQELRNKEAAYLFMFETRSIN